MTEGTINHTFDHTPTEAPSGTEYIILTGDKEGPWAECGRATAATKLAAVRQVAGEKAGLFRAVPARSWDGIVRVTAQQTVKVNVEVI